MSGATGENAIKLYGSDLHGLEATATEIERLMRTVRRVRKVGVRNLQGHLNEVIEVDRGPAPVTIWLWAMSTTSSRLRIGGQTVTQVYERGSVGTTSSCGFCQRFARMMWR